MCRGLISSYLIKGYLFKTVGSIYLPEGNWTNLWTGEKYKGGRTLAAYKVPDDEIPVFVNVDELSEAFEQCRDELIKLHSEA